MLFEIVFVDPAVLVEHPVTILFFIQLAEFISSVTSRKIPSVIAKTEILQESLEFFNRLGCYESSPLDAVKPSVCYGGKTGIRAYDEIGGIEILQDLFLQRRHGRLLAKVAVKHAEREWDAIRIYEEPHLDNRIRAVLLGDTVFTEIILVLDFKVVVGAVV